MEFQEDGYIPVGERPEWAGATPLYPPAACSEVVSIKTDPDHADLMAYFWGAMTAGEKSARVLSLTEEIILNFNSAHFSVWAWRWECLEASGALQKPEGVAAEAGLLRRVATDNAKNYQLWNHRRKFALLRGAQHAGDDLEFSAACLAYDAKNYHAWAHRQAIIAAFGKELSALWGEELSFTEHLLRDDVYNNSAWTQRYFIIEKAPVGLLGTSEEFYNREVDFSAIKISVAPHNQAAWGYLKALTAAPGAPAHALGFEERIRKACIAALQLDASNVPALEVLADFYTGRAEILETMLSSSDEGTSTEEVVNKRKEALVAAKEASVELFKKLQIADPARVPYYSRRIKEASSS